MKNGNIIAIIGPDGSGKTTLAQAILDEANSLGFNIKMVYGSKKKDQHFKITKKSFNIYKFLSKKSKINRWLLLFSASYLVIIHYPIEFVDNIFKIKKYKKETEQDDSIIIFDRYPVDRMLPLTDSFKSKYKGLISKIPWYLFAFYGIMYQKLLPLPDVLIYKDETAKILFERKPEHYKDIEIAESNYKQYRELYSMINLNKSVRILRSSQYCTEELINIVFNET